MFYDAHVKRLAAEQIEARRLSTVSGLLGNSNFDGNQETMKRVEEDFDTVIDSIYGVKEKKVDFASDPFFAAMDLPDADGVKPEDETGFKYRYEIDQN
jgi:hypothetical protein